MPKNQSPRPQDFPTITVRGGRLAKIGKRTASMAPVLGLAAAFAAFGGGSAIAQCVGGPSNFDCTGPITETTQQTFSGANISVELESSFSVDTTDNIGISINSTGGATLLQQGVPGQGANISGDQRGVRVDNTGGGAAIVTTTGAVSGDRALEVINRVGGSDLVINAHDINGFTTGIFMQNNGTGRTDATVTGNIVSVNTANNDSNFDGIFARGRADTTSMRIETFGTVIGGDEGIDAANFGSGDITVITHDTVTSLVEWGVLARSIGDGDVIVRVDGDVEAGGEGIRAINGQAASGGNPAVRPDGDISVTVNGNVNASTVTHGAGVFAQQYGDGTTDMTVLGDVTANSTFSSGVRFSGDGSGDAALVVEGDVDAGALGIDARQSGTGDISIDAIGDVSGFGFVGVYAEGTNGGTEIDINIFGVATSDVQHGAAIFNSGAGSTSLLHIQQGAVVTGGTSSVAVSHDNDEQFEIIIDGIVEAGTEGGLVNGRSFGTDFLSSGVDITIGENGRLGTAGSTAAAFTDNAADGTGLDAGSNLTVNGILAGGVNLGAGSDTVLINETATLEANVFFDGDAMEVGGVATISDSGSDTVQINGGERSFFSDQFNAIELLQISGNAVVTFSDRNATTGLSNSTANLFSLQTDQGTTVLITDDYGVTGDLVNFGTVDLSTAAPTADTTLTIAPDGSGAGGDYISNGGQLRLDTVLNDGVTDQTDLLVVNGDTSGSTTVFVNNVGGTGGETGTGATDGIQIIEVSGASNGTFVLGHPVFAGAYAYGLNQADGQNWYLQSDFAGFASVYEAYPQIIMGLNGLPTLQQRVGNRLWAPNISGMQNSGDAALATGAYGIHSYRGFWSRIEGRREHVEYDNSTTGADHDADYRKYQVGVDALIADKPDHQLFVGLNGFLTSASASVHSPSGIGDMDISGYGIGATATWYNTNGSYIDLQGQYVWHNANLNSDTLGTLVTGNEGNSYALSAEIGRRLERGDYTFTPQAQLIYSNSEFDRFTDPFGTQVSLGSAESLKGRLGLSIDRDTIWTDERGHKQRLHTYFIGNLHKEFLQGTSVSVSGTNLSSSIDGFAGELGLGFTRSINEENLTFYGEANVKTDLANFGDSYTYGGTIGLRVKF